jgi:hypothetical protein
MSSTSQGARRSCNKRRRPAFRLAACVLAVVAGVGIGQAASRAYIARILLPPRILDARPHAIFATREVDLGEVDAGTPLEARFPIRNAGQGRLIVRTAGCSDCASGSRQISLILLPAEDRVLSFPIDPGSGWGPIRRVTRVYTNDSRCPTVDLTITARLQAPRSSQPNVAHAPQAIPTR